MLGQTFRRDSADDSSPADGAARSFPTLARVLIAVAIAAGLVYNLVGLPLLHRRFGTQYRLDLDVYRLGGIAFDHGAAIYGHLPLTQLGKPLPFTYPPLAAISFTPMAWMPLTAAGVVMTLVSVAALAASILLTVRSFGFVSKANETNLLWWAGAALAASFVIEPIFSTYNYGQINMVLMALVVLDCLPKKTPWPRGILIGFVAALKLTPAVFVLYLLLRKDVRAAITSGVSFLVCTGIAFVVTPSDSVKYWTEILPDSNRIGKPAYPGNQSITGVLARLGWDSVRTPLWLLATVVVLAVAALAIHRCLRADQPALALCVNAVAGLLISPVSWSHHWVWIVPLLLSLGVLAYRRRSVALATWVWIGALLFHFAPHWRLAPGRYSGLGWPLWDQFVVSSYVWWGIATVAIVAVVMRAPRAAQVTEPGASEPGGDLESEPAR